MTVPEDIEEENWLAEERRKVAEYLDLEGCRHGGIAEWPTVHVYPDFALWAVQSTRHAGRTGWWVISGDVPTDYMTTEDGEHPRDALRHFSNQWRDVADHMRRGKEHPVYKFGTSRDWPELAPQLELRANALADCADDDEVWEEED
ncbi:MAG: DUF4826 family protein [Akkermansiaceae bacterium]|nr:DUF4826 family protein [Akkermansiaceae bacterium]